MKNLIYTIALVLLANSNAFAYQFGPIKGDDPRPIELPNSGQVIGAVTGAVGAAADAVQNALPVSPKSISCAQTRDDANDHQKQLSIESSGLKNRLPGIATDIQNATSVKNASLQLNSISEKQAKLFVDFQGLSNEQVYNENNLKSSLWSVQSRSSDQNYLALLNELKNDKNPKVKQVALLMLQLTRQSNKDLKALLDNKNSQTYLTTIAGLISATQLDIETQQAINNDTIAKNDKILADKFQEQANINARLQQIDAEYNQQEERKACKP